MYTIQDASKILRITRQAIYHKLNKLDADCLMDGDKGKMLTEKGLESLKVIFNLQDCLHDVDKALTKDYIENLKLEIERLHKIIASQEERATTDARLLENSQVLLKNSQDKILMLENKKSFLDRFRKR